MDAARERVDGDETSEVGLVELDADLCWIRCQTRCAAMQEYNPMRLHTTSLVYSRPLRGRQEFKCKMPRRPPQNLDRFNSYRWVKLTSMTEVWDRPIGPRARKLSSVPSEPRRLETL